MMAESLDDGEFWLPQFLADDDNMLYQKSSGTNTGSDQNWFGSTPHSERPSFLFECGTLGVFSDFSSPGESVKGSSEAESDEDDFVAGLTLRMAHSTIDDGFSAENAKARVVSGSPQSTLCDMGSGSGCSQGSSRGSPKSQCKVASPPATWDLLHAAAGEVARMRMNEKHGVYHGQGLSNPSERTSAVSIPVKTSNTGGGIYQQQMQAIQFQHLQQQEMIQRQNLAVGEQIKAPAGYQQQQIHQMVQGGVRNGDFGCNRDRRSVGLSSTAWLPPQQRHGSGMRALFLGNPGGKRECAGTGVFLPRHMGNQSEPRKKPACSTVLVPARVMQALNLNLDDICSQPHLQPVAAGRINPENDVVLRLQSNRGASHQKRQSRRQPVLDHEIKLPQEWTY